MWFGILILAIALCLSGSAAYYAILGLVAIFPTQFLAIVLMGAGIEAGKVAGVAWLHLYWEESSWKLKAILMPLVLIAMTATSFGVYGFLSKAHVDQTAASTENVAQIERLQTEITRQEGIVLKANTAIDRLESRGSGGQANIQEQINIEQARIDAVYARIKPLIEAQNKIIERKNSLYQNQIDKIDDEVAKLQSHIDNNDIKKAQGMVGASTDGKYGPKTAKAFNDWQADRTAKRQELVKKIEQLSGTPTVAAARKEIARLQKMADDQVAQSNKLINQYRGKLVETSQKVDIGSKVEELQLKIRDANGIIDELTEQKYGIEKEYRKLEAEVGPIKFIAEFIYGEQAEYGLLAKAVRWFTLMLVIIFDPFAIVLVIVAIWTFEKARKKKIEIIPEKEIIKIESEPVDTTPFFNHMQSQEETIKDLEQRIDDFEPKIVEVEKVIEVPIEVEVEKIIEVENTELVEELEAALVQLEEERQELINREPEIIEKEVEKIVEKEVPVEIIKEIENTDRIQELESQIESLKQDIVKRDMAIVTLNEQYDLIEKDTSTALRDGSLKVIADDEQPGDTSAGFGTEFPENPNDGDKFVRVDFKPNKVFEYKNNTWVDITDVKLLIDGLNTGEIDVEDLSDEQQDLVRKALSRTDVLGQ